MLLEFMCPETLIITVDIHPVLLHVVHQVLTSLTIQNRRDIRVLARRVAVLFIRSVAVIRPLLLVHTEYTRQETGDWIDTKVHG